MSLLTPLYVAGLLGISLPILFHLIRRSPSGQLPFSSLMFLSPSPPRLTRRSRIDHWLLLLLRALVLLLLAIAFARPFFRTTTEYASGKSLGRRLVILVDTSASTRREGLWDQVVKEVDVVLEEMEPEDRAALYHFDHHVSEVVPFDHSLQSNQQQRHTLIKQQVRELAPGWAHSQLGLALSTVASELETLADQDDIHMGAMLQVILISDLQQGVNLQHLESFEWPEHVKLQLRPITCSDKTNASLHLIADRTQSDQADNNWRLRINNTAGSEQETYRVQWANPQGPIPDLPPNSVYVLPGKSHVMRLPERKQPSWDRLILSGDNHAFDNTLFLAPRVQEQINIAFVGRGAKQDPKELLYYLDSVFSHDPLRQINVIQLQQAQQLEAQQNLSIKLIVAAGELDAATINALATYVSRGGHLLYVTQQASNETSLQALMQDNELQLQEAEIANYSMLSDIDFTHPLFAPFSSPQFRDFKSIHFWHHRKLEIQERKDRQVLARFDNGDIAMVEQRMKRGTIWVLAAGWHPHDSQLARSKKFLPLMAGILDRSIGVLAGVPQFSVGEEVNCLLFGQQPRSITVYDPEQQPHTLTADETHFTATTQPGIYRWETDQNKGFFAVNLASQESQTAPLDPTRLEQHGIPLGSQLSSRERKEQERQMRDRELESRQKVWQWLIALAVGVVLSETWVAGRLARSYATDTKEAS